MSYKDTLCLKSQKPILRQKIRYFKKYLKFFEPFDSFGASSVKYFFILFKYYIDEEFRKKNMIQY